MFEKMNNIFAFSRWHFAIAFQLPEMGCKPTQWGKNWESDPFRHRYPTREGKVCHKIIDAKNTDTMVQPLFFYKRRKKDYQHHRVSKRAKTLNQVLETHIHTSSHYSSLQTYDMTSIPPFSSFWCFKIKYKCLTSIHI